ncbi:response regulator receiver modulated diguanylate cyclase [Geobacter metallireducens RCH3]|uniref:Sensor histidine kinase response receiver diguanylate cyclase n=1 Tax=Geobacter metallireducens (strain ATCC 53774 / DSM 7210 / GS-15) TaxID=269799 RepID=Q39ZN1_GEOMG|nr:diguanylate cyclase [Geobacter metallireducens]ABB30293.1 sensor histidine kinase response receiver diguanylate cyclase [Geobacter metallireducens GS-15]EHP85610.1 response regulator receiver modulated diguanylate cyclase [Geobacter metallireducens RCH3]
MAGSRKIVSARELDLLRRLLRERTEELERANERLFMATQVKSEFLSHMSREFQRPLDRIVDFASCLRDGAMGEVNPEQRSGLDAIVIRGMRLQRMLQRVLELCSSDLGMAVFLPKEFPVEDALERVVKRLRERAEKQGVAIDAGCVDGGTLLADEGKFSFIIEELATNALKFSPRGSRITVRLRNVTGGREERFLEVAVSDQGPGIREEELGQIFKSFEMGSGAIASPGSLGLGLALVKHFVDLHGGRISVESQAGEGSSFTVLLPKGGPSVRMVRTPRVLVAGLEEDFAGPLLSRLRDEGYETITAGGGQDALDKGISMAPDLCILSLSLPEVGGIDVCLRLKAHERSKQIPVIITAPYPDRSAKVGSAQAGADGFFALPAETEELFLKARSLIAQKLNYDFLKRNYEIAASEAFTDPLTGLFNLRQFWLSLDHELARARRYGRHCSLAMIDIDFFKQYNDRHGHLRGDEVLKEISKLFVASIRNSDIAARYGGEEFVVIMPETGRDLALIAGEKLRRAVAEHPFSLQETQPGGLLTVSVGIATFPDDAATAREMVDAADQALYRAKGLGRDRVESRSP